MEKKASDGNTSKNIFSDEEIMDITEMVAETAEEFDEIFIADSDEASATQELMKSVNNGDDCCKSIFNTGNITLNANTTFSEAELIGIAEAITECASEFSQNFNDNSQDNASPDRTMSTKSQHKKGEKRQSKRKGENNEETEKLNNPKEKVIESEVKITEEDEELRCSICTELFIRAVTLNCSHTFCNYCIDRWRRNSSQCPICRIKIDGAYPTLIIDKLIEKEIDKCTDEVKQLRDKMIEERSAGASAMNVDNGPIIVIDSQESDEVEDDEDMEEDEVMVVEPAMNTIIVIDSQVSDEVEDDEEMEDDEDTDEDEVMIVEPAMNVDNGPTIVIDSQVSVKVEENEDTEEEDEEYELYGYYVYEPNYYYYNMYDDYVTPFYRARRPYYGGYGRCYICNERGHWAPGCPLRLRRS